MKVLKIIPNADLRAGHLGLSELAKVEFKTDVSKLRENEFIMFINHSQTMVKIFAANNYLLFYKRPDGTRLNAQALMSLPNFVKGQSLDYSAALKATITKQFGSRKEKCST